MTVSNTNRRAGPFPGADSPGPFGFDFYTPAPEDVVAIRADPLGAETTLIYGAEFSVTLNDDQSENPGGDLLLTDALPTGYTLTLTSAAPALQPTDITNLSGFYQKLITLALDRLTVLVQQTDEKVGRAVKVPISSTITPDDLINQLTNAASDAVNAAGAAAVSEGNAHDSELAAGLSASAALVSEGKALASEQAAATSESNAHDSELAAATSEGNAHDSEVAAGLSQAAALVSEGKAHDSELAAATSEGNAADSELAAKTYLETLVQPFAFMKADYDTPCLKKTGAQTVSIKAGTVVVVAGVARLFAVDTAVVMPALTAGEDYSVWVKADGTAVAVVDSFAAPAVAPEPGAVRIGGFHHGLVAPGTTVASGSFSTGPITGSGGPMAWTQADVDKLAGINAFSFWDLAFRCAGEQYGMSYDPWTRVWVAIYFCNTAPHANGISRYNTDIASGTVLPFVVPSFGGNGVLKYAAMNSWTAYELATDHGLRLPTYADFMSAAFGVTEAQSLGGGAVTVPATLRQPGFTSRIGLEQATGHQWWIGDMSNAVGGSAYSGNGRGSWYGSYGMPLFSGYRGHTSNSGSRCANFDNGLSLSSWNTSLRAAGDPQKTIGPALYQEAA
ncbi:phage major tropism determinant [Castellaniella caeni]|uniref:phage major tropism determinant n=1 Tax=Castellaniella caeni TaxID=266123 RepID=UPI000C9EFF0E|nr:hypothetical protein [Castellaniella caeni]